MVQKRKLIIVILSIFAIVTVMFCVTVWRTVYDNALIIRFLDVGQGDAILISQGIYQVLIDGGKNEQRLLEHLGMSMPFWDRTVEVVVATHPDQDHIGGLLGVFKSYEVGRVLHTLTENDSQLFARWEETIGREETIETFAPLNMTLPNKARITSLYPARPLEPDEMSSPNDASIVLKIEYGENTFLLMGDLPEKFEGQLDASEIGVLKVGHHGSKSSTSENFLETARPTQAIISVGGNNRYGHPNLDVMERLKERNIQILRTDKQGTITYRCDKEEMCEVSVEQQ